MEYAAYNNAGVLLEVPGGEQHYNNDSFGHLDGRVAETKKLFGVIDSEKSQWDAFYRDVKKETGILIYRGKVRTIASERQNRLIVST